MRARVGMRVRLTDGRVGDVIEEALTRDTGDDGSFVEHVLEAETSRWGCVHH